MANTKISDLSAGAAVGATDVFPNVQSTGSGPVKTTAAQLKTFMSASPTISGALTLGTSGILVGGTNLIEQRNGATAQERRLYNTYTDGSNNEYLESLWSGNTLYFRTRNNGTGSARAMNIGSVGSTTTLYAGASLIFSPGGANAWTMSTSGHLITGADNTYDIGASGATRPRNVYVAGTGTFGGAVAIGNTVNSVSPTSPNRTITMVVGGVTLYIAAKTTND